MNAYTGMDNPGQPMDANPAEGTGADELEDQQSTASQQSSYVAPSDGQPTICQNCAHFDGQGQCDHPDVIADPEVQGTVEANGHSKFFYPKSQEAAENGGMAPRGKKPANPNATADDLGAGARFPRASNTPNFQGD